MSGELRFVFDTNVLLSALLFGRSVPAQAFEHAVALGRLLISEPLALELDDVLRRGQFGKYLTLEERVRFLAKFIREALPVEITQVIAECRDPKDDKILELAVEGRSTCVVTGDDDLLTLNPFRGIPIVTPRDLLSRPWPDPAR